MPGVIVHEWIEQIGGSENVLDQLADIFPDAPIYCLWNNAPERFAPGRVRETWLARTPIRKFKPLALLFTPFVWRRLKIDFQPDWILTSSHLFAHHAKFLGIKPVKKYAYVYSPARYIWNPEIDERGKPFFVRMVAPLLKKIDRYRSKELYSVAGISETVSKRIKQHWEVDAEVIYPPVDVDFYLRGDMDLTDEEQQLLASLPGSFVLAVSRFIPYKRMDLAIKYAQVTNQPLVLAGNGPDLEELLTFSKKSVNPLTKVVVSPSKNLLKALYRRASVLVFAAIEDFGIIPVEAMATGTPVVGLDQAGVSETVIDGKTGSLLEDFSEINIRKAHIAVAHLSIADCTSRPQEFSTQKFKSQILNWVSGP